MYSKQKILWAVLLLAPMIFYVTGTAQAPDDDEPEVKARVARVTYVSGDVQIKRAGETSWEVVKQDLPVVEGDEIATDAKSRVEIQLDSNGHVRLEENSYLQVVTLREEGTALSVPRGTMSVRLLDFDKARSYVEIDAPKSTIAVQKAGIYRVDSGNENSQQVGISVTESGEARVYSDNSGFTVKNGRSATVNVEGDQEGEWETVDAARYADDFDIWALDRDVAIEKKLKDAYFDKYYDRDIYGAEDLNDNGEWIHTNKYGYVWRPYANATSGYADWSPYRYGEWRWIPTFGWTWVNDEPWGWATYHHGRWLFDDGYWVWSPYGYYRNHRSWWSPALVVLTILNDDICWYPLPYTYAYYDYNSYYYGGGRHHGHHDGHPVQPPANPQLSGVVGPGRMGSMPYYQVPVGGVVKTPKGSFGTGKGGIQKAPGDIAKGVLARDPAEKGTLPKLPKFGEISGSVGTTIRVERPILAKVENQPRTGATTRNPAKPLDDELRTTRVMGKRPPASSGVIPGTPPPKVDRGGKKLPDTGAVERPKLPASDTPTGKSVPRSEEPTKRETPRTDTPRRSVEPRNDPPKREEPRSSSPPKQEQPRSESPKSESPKSSPPSQPKNDPPARSQPKDEGKPDTGRSKKDGRR